MLVERAGVSPRVDPTAWVAPGATLIGDGAEIATRAEVRVNGTVHLLSRLPEGAVVPIGWVAIGDPARILPPGSHEEIWEIQESLDFPGEIFGVTRSPDMMREIMDRYVKSLGRHRDDRVIDK